MRRLALVLVAACSAPAARRQVLTTPPPPPPPKVVEAPKPPPPADEVPKLRLPRVFTPTSYDAKLVIDPAKPTFSGSIVIHGTVSATTDVVWLHGRHLKITDAHGLAVTPRGDDLLEVRGTFAPGDATIALDYTGEIDEINTTGMFEETVAGKRYVYSQFEAIYARRAFPCLDEPDSKVPWQLTIVAPKSDIAVSNTPVVKDTELGAMHQVEFARTKPLPSYLIAFGVGPFDVVDAGKTKSGVPVRIVTLAGRSADAAWAAKATPKILDLEEEWFGIPYPYEKADMLTIPQTVGFGAMENPGLVTYSESYMLVDAAHPSWHAKFNYVIGASHELAHQWFGDYVTTAWWDDIWLNEGFANWMEGKIAGKFEPSWHLELSELGMRESALGADAVVSARQVRQPIEKVDDILNAFDSITYDKGGSLLNMFEAYVGKDVFQKAVREYLKSKAFGNATSADFVAAVSAATGKDLGQAFSSFLDQAGEPEITMTVDCKGGPKVQLAQQRFVAPGSPKPPEGKPWVVPVCVAYDRGGTRAQACTLLDAQTGTLALEGKSCPRWVMPNVDARGYYVAKLTPAQITALRDEAWGQLSWTERRLIDETTTRAASFGSLPIVLGLSFVPKMLAGGDRFTIGDSLGFPLGLERWVAEDQRPKYEAWLRTTFGPGAAKVGLVPKDNDDLDVDTIRNQLMWAAAYHGRDPELVKQAIELAGHWRDLPAAIRATVLGIAVDANADIGAQVQSEIKQEKDRRKRNEMIDALTNVRDPKRYEAALALLLDPGVDFRETMWMLNGASTDATRAIAQAFYRAHEAEILKRMPQDETAGATAGMAWVFAVACDATKRDELADYITKHFASMPGGEREAKQAIEGMDQCIASRKLLEPEVRGWIGGYKIPKPKDSKKK
jgi:alanyl aminopeptidase